MSPEANHILDVLRSHDLHSGGFVHFTNFGDAMTWEGGYVRDEPVRAALRSLIGQGFVREMNTGLELTERGNEYLYPDATKPAVSE